MAIWLSAVKKLIDFERNSQATSLKFYIEQFEDCFICYPEYEPLHTPALTHEQSEFMHGHHHNASDFYIYFFLFGFGWLYSVVFSV